MSKLELQPAGDGNDPSREGHQRDLINQRDPSALDDERFLIGLDNDLGRILADQSPLTYEQFVVGAEKLLAALSVLEPENEQPVATTSPGVIFDVKGEDSRPGQGADPDESAGDYKHPDTRDDQ